MRIILAHNYYQQPGGEDQVFRSEGQLLERYGHQVYRYIAHNDDVTKLNKAALARKSIWNSQTYRDLRSYFRRVNAEIFHAHNTFPLISPSSYYAAKAESVAVIQTLHNYRLFCPAANFFRDGHVCEDCLGKFIPLPSVVHGCYRNSRPASATVAAMLAAHRARRTWLEQIDLYITMTEFSRLKFIQGGLPAEKIVVKSHFVDPDPGIGPGGGKYALYVGRLSPEKGLNTLLSAWGKLGQKLPLKIVGGGPLEAQVKKATNTIPNVTWLGYKTRAEVNALIGEAMMLIVPSECYETFGLVAAEAFAKGTPVIASSLGAVGEVVEHGRTGRHFHPKDTEALRSQAEWMLSNPAAIVEMRKEARATYEAKYTAESNYDQLMEIYQRAIS